ncbi:MAG: hypothetical protein HZC44_05230 [Geobacter sp.]|nr:hypothetical protein [Geobacter sp.]
MILTHYPQGCLAVACAAVLAAAPAPVAAMAAGGEQHMKLSVAGLSNADVRWHGTRAGFTPEMTGEKAMAVAGMGDQVVPQLLALLDDEQAFIAAHVLLTRISGVEYQPFPLWNGLALNIAADGTVTVDPAQRFVLARRWGRWYSSRPRPALLPSED